MKGIHIKWGVWVILLLSILVFVSFLSISLGEVNINFFDIPSFLSDSDSLEYGVLRYIRIPRTVLAIAVGGGLSLSGAILQGVYRNPLVEPYTLGISGGASLGVTVVIVMNLHVVSYMFLPMAGFLGSLATVFAVYLFGACRKGVSINRMLLVGVMISFVSSSLMMFFMSITDKDKISDIIFWIMGSLNESNQTMINTVLALSLICLALSYAFVTPLNALRLGKDKAKYLGIDSDYVIRILFILTSIMTGCCISTSGVIGFVGLVIPHFVRTIIGSDYRILLLSSFLSGGIFLILSDIVARTVISPNELPIGVITGIIGGVAFIFIMWNKRYR